jgi:hypothetical protein
MLLTTLKKVHKVSRGQQKKENCKRKLRKKHRKLARCWELLDLLYIRE